MKKSSRIISLLLTCVMLLSMAAVSPFGAAAAEADGDAGLIEGTYVHGQVIVMFRSGAIDTDTVPDKGELAAVGADFGEMMDASSSSGEAYSAAD